MTASVTFSQLYWDKGLMNFFFREQSRQTLEELFNNTDDKESLLNYLDDYLDERDLDDVEECFYSMTTDELIKEFEIV